MEVPDYPDYLVYEDGRVFSIKSRKMLKQTLDKYGYHYISLCKDGKGKWFKVHRVVAIAYIPNPENKPDVDHIDRVRTNNHVSNLRWATRSENCLNTIVRKNNKLGIKNIHFDKQKQRYIYQKVLRGDYHCKHFKTVEEAIAYKEEFEATLR